MAENLLEDDPSLVFTKQFENPANPAVHFLSTGPEIWAQTQGKVDVFLAGVGTGGTVTGRTVTCDGLHVQVLPAVNCSSKYSILGFASANSPT
jgi:cysteine synthase